jgi:hypothetical protein
MDQPTERKQNEEQFEVLLATIKPELWRINQALKDTGVNEDIITAFVYALHTVAYQTGHGDVTAYVTTDSDNNVVVSDISPKMRMGFKRDVYKLKRIIKFEELP